MHQKRPSGHAYPARSPALIRLAATTIFSAFLFGYVLIPTRVQGSSMEPAYKDGSLNFINALAYIRSEPRRGDAVGIVMAGRRVMFLKRIIGLPGEKIRFEGGSLFIDGAPHPEPYLKIPCGWNMNEIIIGKGEYFVAGDNRKIPIEDHTIGRVSRKRVAGRILF